MGQTDALGRRVQHLRAERGLSAYALAKLSGYSLSYIRMVERGMRRPGADTINAIGNALDPTGVAAAELRRLAGIDPDPAATAEAKAARRIAWPALLYVLVNHVLLPRLELAGLLSRTGRRSAFLRAAAESIDVVEFQRAASKLGSPPPPLRRMIEDTLGALPADTVHQLMGDVQHMERWETPRESPAFYFRGRVPVSVLLPLRSAASAMDTLDFVENFSFDRNFAVRLFPHTYFDACRCWPFQKVHLPLGRLHPDAQRELYNAIHAGLTLAELDRALVGEGPLGSRLRDQATRRPTFDERRPGFAGRPEAPAIFDLDERNAAGVLAEYHGPRPRVDSLFDHLDRCDFLDRFPLLKIDHRGSCELAAARSLPSWTI